VLAKTLLACAAAGLFTVGGGALGQERYPSHAVRLIVPFAPGGGADISARAIAAKLTDRFGQQVLVDNRPGAGGNVGTDLASKSASHGYTLLLLSSSYGAYFIGL
jgi:tripartite-type tricarboxylate transporter receptor subunit TctC